MTKRTVDKSIAGLAGLVVGVLLLVAAQQRSTLPQPPNILIIMADDMGYSDIGCYGGEVRTPHLDQLAQNGLRFRQFYNAARCCPTRAALLTGRYPHEAGMAEMVHPLKAPLPTPGPYQGYLNDSPTLAEQFRKAGYGTYMSGKWHVGEKPAHWPRKRGFDRYFGLISGASSYFELLERGSRQIVLDDDPWEPPAQGFYMTDATTDFAQQFLKEHSANQPQKPFLLYMAYTAPHWPLHALPEDIARYEKQYDEGWDKLRQTRFERMKALGVLTAKHELSERPADLPAWEDVPNKAEWSRKMAVYAAMIDRMDQGIGRIVAQLKASGKLDNTLILFLSDNGGCHENIEGRKLNDPSVPIGARGSYVAYDAPWAYASNTPFRKFKSWAHEGGIATPLIVHWPARLKAKGAFTDQVGYVADLLPTCLEAAGLPPSGSGESLLQAFLSPQKTRSRTLFWEHFGNKAIRQGDWKLVYGKPENEWELYNLRTDPTERQNLAAAQPKRVASLRAAYTKWADQVGIKEK